MASREIVNFIRAGKLTDGFLAKLEIALLSVNTVLEDAEDKQLKNAAAKQWIDELATEALLSNVNAEYQPTQLIIEPEIEKVIGDLELLAERKDVIGLGGGVGGKPSRKLPTTYLVEETGICGRDDDRGTIFKLLISDDGGGYEIYVIAIVGMGRHWLRETESGDRWSNLQDRMHIPCPPTPDSQIPNR